MPSWGKKTEKIFGIRPQVSNTHAQVEMII